MNAGQKQVHLSGSTKHRPQAAEVVGDVPSVEFPVTVMVRRRNELPPLEEMSKRKPREREYLSREAHAARHGADPADLAKVEEFARANGLRIAETSANHRRVTLYGTPEAYGKAFGVQLKMYKSGEATYRGREGDILIPQNLQGIVTSVTGLDNRPFARPHYRVLRGTAHAAGASASAGSASAAAAASIPTGFTPLQLAALYNFPPNLDGTGQTVAILELGGGFRTQELNAYFQNLGLANPPSVTAVPFPNGGTNSPGTNALDPSNPDVEVMLDIEVAGAVAPGAKFVVYFAPDATDQSFLNVMSAILNDTVNKPNIVSISWGGPEDAASDQFKNEFDQMLQSAGHLGVTVCVAAGDNGSADFHADDPNWDGKAHVDFPASDPFALACGGTQLTASGGAISKEVVWHDGANDGTGGGVSRFFALPSYQQGADRQPAVNPPGPVMRGVPDVAGDAAPGSGYRIVCDGTSFPDPSQGLPPVGGTSAVAPLLAGLIARISQGLNKPAGFINPLLYATPANASFRDITQGNNGDYKAGAGWDPCTGLGSPNGQKLLAALTS
ncbi:MAG TPA: S53 family peptidase [Candidatus Methylomirabilis sp.]|nr:S53 family peptidase [Candidatus Methylomirabilis sp.]